MSTKSFRFDWYPKDAHTDFMLLSPGEVGVLTPIYTYGELSTFAAHILITVAPVFLACRHHPEIKAISISQLSRGF